MLKGQLYFGNTFPGALDVHSRFQIPILNSGNPSLLTQSGKTENKPWQTKSQRALLRGKCKQFYILFIDFPMFSLRQKHQEWYELYCGGKSDLFLSPSLFPTHPPPPPPTSDRITRQKRTQQNISLSKQAEDLWAPIGRCNSHSYHQGVLGPVWLGLPPGGGELGGGGGRKGRARGQLLSYLSACGCVSNTARTCKSERLPIHVCIQTGYCQVQVVGPAEQSGKLYT